VTARSAELSSTPTTKTRPRTRYEELIHDLGDAADQTREEWLTKRSVVATFLETVKPHLEAAFHRGRLGRLRDQDLTVPSLKAPLSEREKQVGARMARGLSNAAIGLELFISEDTVKTYARRLFKKIGAHDRAHAVALLLIRGDITAADVLEPLDDDR